MVLLLVSTLPPLAAFAYCTAMLLRKGDRKKWLRLCVVTAVILVTISTFYLSYLSVEPPLPYATFVTNIMLMSLIPLMYVMVSNQFALKYLDQYFLWIIGYTILALPYQVCQLLYPLPQLMPEHWGNNMMRLSFNAKDYSHRTGHLPADVRGALQNGTSKQASGAQEVHPDQKCQAFPHPDTAHHHRPCRHCTGSQSSHENSRSSLDHPDMYIISHHHVVSDDTPCTAPRGIVYR